jgi:hypothetical protein
MTSDSQERTPDDIRAIQQPGRGDRDIARVINERAAVWEPTEGAHVAVHGTVTRVRGSGWSVEIDIPVDPNDPGHRPSLHFEPADLGGTPAWPQIQPWRSAEEIAAMEDVCRIAGDYAAGAAPEFALLSAIDGLAAIRVAALHGCGAEDGR